MHDYRNRCPSWAFRIDRATPYGNPFVMGAMYEKQGPMTREDAVKQHNDWLLNSDEGLKVLEKILS